MERFASFLALTSVFAMALAPGNRGFAQVDPWEFEVYPYATEQRGKIELESLNSVITNGHHAGENGTSAGTLHSQGMYRTALELTYGLTDRIEAAAYLDLAQARGRGFWYAGSKYRLRGRFFDQDTLPLELGWYAELEWHKTPQFDRSDLELELRPIFEKDLGRFSLIIEPKFEKSLAGAGHNQGVEFGYVSGAYYQWREYLSPGIEFYGGIGKIQDSNPVRAQQHYIFPVVQGEIAEIEYNVGPGFGLTRGSDRVIVKFDFELERFVGTIFSPSSDTAWFF
jgi:hypothetical protein